MQGSDLHPRLMLTVTATHDRIGRYPSIRYGISSLLYQTPVDIAALIPPPSITVIHQHKNQFVTEALTDIAGHINFNRPYPTQDLTKRLQNIGQWVAENIFPASHLLCCHGALPSTIEIVTDQQDIPWEIVWIEDGFLGSKAVHSRYPFVSQARHKALAFRSRPRLAIVVGRVQGLSPQAEIDAIRKAYTSMVGLEAPIFSGEKVTPSFLRRLLTGDPHDSGSFFDLIHFIGHGDSNGDHVWLELGTGPFLEQNVPPALAGNPLIFWNSCYGGASTLARYRYQSDVVEAFGSQLLASGASHFIGPMFPVLDSTAVEFATRFYQQIFQGYPVGSAFFEAKRQVACLDPVAHGYVLYGNPLLPVLAND